MTGTGKEIVIRLAEPGDAATIHGLVRDLARYENLLHQVKAGAADLRRDGFGPRPFFECLLAECGGEAVGFALFFPVYSTFEGRPGLYLEDLFVAEAARGGGLGRRLIARLAALALERGWARVDLAALDWNPARGFYAKLGFRQVEAWLPYRLEGAALERLAGENPEEPVTAG